MTAIKPSFSADYFCFYFIPFDSRQAVNLLFRDMTKISLRKLNFTAFFAIFQQTTFSYAQRRYPFVFEL